MEGHDREQLAALGQRECDVVDVLETGVSEWRCEGGGDRDEE